jgi:hypothetical protein
MNQTHYSFIGDENELKWFFDHCIKDLNIGESYSFSLVARKKKLTDEERKEFTMSSNEILNTEILRKPKGNLTFNHLLKLIYGFNKDKRFFTNDNGISYPQKCLVIFFSPNPANVLNCVTKLEEDVDNIKREIFKNYQLFFEKIKNNLNNSINENKDFLKENQNYLNKQFFKLGNLDKKFKNYHSNITNKIYNDFDIDFPNAEELKKKGIYDEIHNLCIESFEKRNFFIIDTNGGYHILIKSKKLTEFCQKNKCGTDIFIQKVNNIINDKINKYYKELKKSEVNIDDYGIGIPLPGTLQYLRLVNVKNKDDFE